MVKCRAGQKDRSNIFSAPRYQGPKSDHFDGRIFHNQKRFPDRTMREVFRWRRERVSRKWGKFRIHPPGPPPPKRVDRGCMRVTFINHATTLIQMDNLNILTDPIWSNRCSPLPWAGPKRIIPPGVRLED